MNTKTKIPWNKGKKLHYSVWNKGKKLPQCSGVNHPMWKGGIYTNNKGYVFIYSPNHPNKNKDGYVLEHRLNMEKKIGRLLTSKEVIHHKNENPSDNRIKNLKLCKDEIEHRRIHAGYKKINKKWFKLCKVCKKYLVINGVNFYKKKNTVSYRCKKHHGRN